MTTKSVHPSYTEFLPDWTQMVDTNRGERKVKEKGQTYLPATVGMVADGLGLNQPGGVAYSGYKARSRFPDIISTAIKALVGLMHTKPPTIELPTVMEPMIESATNDGEGLEVLLRRINEDQLITGRIGLLLDVATGSQVGILPYIATYDAESILNWDDGSFDSSLVLKSLNFVALDESTFERTTSFEWEFQEKQRILLLGEVEANEATGVYRTGVFEDETNFNEAAMVEPSLGGRTLDFIPFTFINAIDIVPSPDRPPLLGLSDLALGIYRGEADYRQALFMQGQDTLVITGANDPDASHRTGAGAVLNLPTGGDAKFIGVDSTGLSEMRQALENDKIEATSRSGDMVDKASTESGDALRIRVVARTATLNQVAKTGAFGLEQCLKQAAIWIGANPDEVKVTANLDFVNDELGGEELVKLITAKALGAPLSNVSIHQQMSEKGMTELTLEEELDKISNEEPLIVSSNPEDLPGEEDENGNPNETQNT